MECLVCVICNSNSIHSFIIKTLHYDCKHIGYVHLLVCARLPVFLLIFGGFELPEQSLVLFILPLGW